MLLCAAGDIHGAIDQLYRDVLAFENALGLRFDVVLHIGDFGVWPDPNRVDRAATSRRPIALEPPASRPSHEGFEREVDSSCSSCFTSSLNCLRL